MANCRSGFATCLWEEQTIPLAFLQRLRKFNSTINTLWKKSSPYSYHHIYYAGSAQLCGRCCRNINIPAAANKFKGLDPQLNLNIPTQTGHPYTWRFFILQRERGVNNNHYRCRCALIVKRIHGPVIHQTSSVGFKGLFEGDLPKKGFSFFIGACRLSFVRTTYKYSSG